MLQVGTSLTDAMRALEGQTTNEKFRSIVGDLSRDMEEGRPFSAALKRHPHVFEGVFVSMVGAGESGGYLHDALDRIVEMKEKRQAMIADVRAALTYPIILGVMSTGVIIFVLTGVLPKFMPFFEGKESLLPITTRVLMVSSTALQNYWWAIGIVIAAIVTAVKFFFASTPGRWLIDRLSLALPVIGPLTNRILTGQLLRTMGHLLESHVSLTEAIVITRGTLSNQFYRELLNQVEETVLGGGRLARAFMGFSHMPQSVRQMIETGEESGNLYPVMLRLAKHYDSEIEQDLKRVASLVEPIALVVLGGIVGVIVASVILPLFKLAHAIH